jgi:hypothetical protein
MLRVQYMGHLTTCQGEHRAEIIVLNLGSPQHNTLANQSMSHASGDEIILTHTNTYVNLSRLNFPCIELIKLHQIIIKLKFYLFIRKYYYCMGC